ncbi:Gfo/Idh/MocA family protein [Virgibacillus ainsalahensis]
MNFSTIGTSWITQSFIDAAKASGRAQLHSVYSRSENTADNFAKNNGITNSFTNIDEMLENPTDFIYVASPNVLHYEHILKCIAKGKHVFCEKPMVYTEKQWREIEEAADRQGVFIFEGYRHLFSPNYETLKKHLPHIGQVRSAMLQYVQYSSRYDVYKGGEEEVPNVFSKEFAGGALMDLGVYPLSMAIDLFGDPKDIEYFPVKLSNGIDGSGTLIVMYEDFHVTILCSKIAQGTIPSEIHGEDGSLTLNHIAPIESLKLYNRKTKQAEELAQDQAELDMVYQVQAFADMIESNNRTYYHFLMERSRQVVRMLEKARRKQNIYFPGE